MGGKVVAIAGGVDVVDVTLTLNTSAYAAGDVLVVPQEIPGVVPGGTRVLRSVLVLDEDDQAQPFDLVFMDATGSLGTINSAVSISDADARKIIGIVEIADTDYFDLVNSQIAMRLGLDVVLKAASSSSGIWVGAISRGTGTYTASGIRLKLGFVA